MVSNRVNGGASKIYRLTWSDFGSSLSKAAEMLRNQDDLTDVTVCAGGKIFPAHKLVLSSASPLLMELLKSTKCQHPVLILAGISDSDFEILLDFVYQGEVNINSEKLPSLLQAAQLLNIQALSTNALILNSSQETFSWPTNVAQDTDLLSSNVTLNKNEIVSREHRTEDFEPFSPSQKRKRSDCSRDFIEQQPNMDNFVEKLPHATNLGEKSIPPPANRSISNQATLPIVKTYEMENQEDEKKIISDLPVNCRLCGVTIRQSRNLRRHIDHMHLKQKLCSKSKNGADKLDEKNFNLLKMLSDKKVEDMNNNPGSSAIFNFSEDSFSQLSEEILQCTRGSTMTPAENSISSSSTHFLFTSPNNTLVMDAAKTQNCLAAVVLSDAVAPHASIDLPEPTLSPLFDNKDTTSSLSSTSSLVAAIEKNTIVPRNKSASNETCTSAETFECNNSNDSCNMNETTLRDLENQLFSACFCSAETDDV